MMKNNLSEFRSIEIYVDEKNDEKNIVIFSKSKNPKYNSQEGEPAYLASIKPIELYAPYTIEEVAEAIEKGISDWGRYEPYIDNKKSVEEWYYNIRGFKEVSYKKKYISLGWNDFEGKYVNLFLPMKTKKYYLLMKSTNLPENAGWLDFADVVMEYIYTDITKLNKFKTYKNQLNL